METESSYLPALKRNNEIWTSTQMARTQYFGIVVWGGDGSHFSVVYDNHTGKQVRNNLQNPPYLLTIALSAAKSRPIRIREKHKIFEMGDTQPDDILYRLAFVYDKLRSPIDEDDDTGKNLQALFSDQIFGLESLYVMDGDTQLIDVTVGKEVLTSLDTMPDKLDFLFWVGEKIPLLVMIDEISAKEIVPREGQGTIVDDMQKQSIIMMREKCKGVVYPNFYSKQNANVDVPIFVQDPTVPSDDDDTVMNYYRSQVENGNLEIYRSKAFQAAVNSITGLPSNHRYTAYSNFIIFAEDKEVIDQDVMNASYSVEIDLPDADIRRGIITKVIKDFELRMEKGNSKIKSVVIKYGNRLEPGSAGTIEDLVSALAGTNSREINEILNSKLDAGHAYAMIDGSTTACIYVGDLAEFRRKIINQSPALELVEPDHTLADVQGLSYIKPYLEKLIETVKDSNRHPTLPAGVLCMGPPGTGKTFSAEAVMAALTAYGFTGVYLHIDQLLGSYVGQTEMQTRQTISTIKALYKAVIWIDEIDRKSMSTEEKGPSGDSGTTNRMQTRLMEFMGDGANKGRILLFAATNFPKNIDTALLDRFPIRLPYMPPDEQGRADQFESKLKKIASAMALFRQLRAVCISHGRCGI